VTNAELERNYECPRCGMKAIVVVRGERSMTPWQRGTEASVSLSIEDGMRRQDDATKTLGLVSCPSCSRRPALALVWSGLRVIGCGIGAAFVVLMGTRGRLLLAYLPLLFVGGCAIGVAIEARRWHAAGKIVVLRMISGPPPKAVATRKALPVAKPAPPAPPPPPPPPITPSAPVERDLPLPADPSQGPRFLK
jgi:DNA-directed RNA polymerase subunit RPC12/RpoP